MIRPIGICHTEFILIKIFVVKYIIFLCITINCDSAIGGCIGQSHLVLLNIKIRCQANLLDNNLGLKSSKTTWFGPLNFRTINHPTVQGYCFFAQYGCSSTGRCGCFEFFLVVHTFETMLTINHGWFFVVVLLNWVVCAM